LPELPRELRIVVRPYATALPLGFFSFGVGMLVLAGLGNGWLPASDQHTAGILLAAFVFPLETIATVFAFLARDAFGATGLGMFSSSWLTLGLADLTGVPGVPSRAVGLYLLGFSFMIGFLAVAAFLGKPLIGTLLLLATVRGALTGAWEFGAPHSLDVAASWIAVALFAAAAYGGLAFLLEDVKKERVLPVFRRGSSRESLEGDLTAQLERIADEAGVRQTL
jgi:succinate-acetate transporter protein